MLHLQEVLFGSFYIVLSGRGFYMVYCFPRRCLGLGYAAFSRRKKVSEKNKVARINPYNPEPKINIYQFMGTQVEKLKAYAGFSSFLLRPFRAASVVW